LILQVTVVWLDGIFQAKAVTVLSTLISKSTSVMMGGIWMAMSVQQMRQRWNQDYVILLTR